MNIRKFMRAQKHTISESKISKERRRHNLHYLIDWDVFYKELRKAIEANDCDGTNTVTRRLLLTLPLHNIEHISNFIKLNGCECDCDVLTMISLMFADICIICELELNKIVDSFCEETKVKRNAAIHYILETESPVV
jgi:hypothetical protein